MNHGRFYKNKKKQVCQKVQLDFSVIQVRGVTLFSRQFHSAPGETRLPTEVKVGVSPPSKEIFGPQFEIQQVFFLHSVEF